MVRHRVRRDSLAEATERPAECDVRDCQEKRDRSLPTKRVSEALPSLKWRKGLGGARRVQLCRTHYREYRKATKETRKLERLGLS